MRIYLIFGGKSAEHDISILTAFSITQAIYYKYYDVVPVYIQKNGQWLKGQTLTQPCEKEEDLHFVEGVNNVVAISPADIKQEEAVIFPVLHGPNGEDGTVQGLFEVLDMPYVGNGVLASAAGMDKIASKSLFLQAGIPQVPFVPVISGQWREKRDEVVTQCEGALLYPMFVKPANMGSSVGIKRAENKIELIEAIDFAFKYDRRVIVEQGLEARELEVGILGNEDVHTSLPGEIVKTVAFYDYDAKYINNDIQMAIPAPIDEALQDQLRNYAKKAFLALDGCGLARCDFFLTANDEVFLNEVNTLPGFTQFSMYPLLFENMGLNYGDLVEELIQLALNRFEQKKSYQKNF